MEQKKATILELGDLQWGQSSSHQGKTMRFFLFSSFLRAKFWLGWWHTWAILLIFSTGAFCGWALFCGDGFHDLWHWMLMKSVAFTLSIFFVFGGFRSACFSVKSSPQTPAKIAIENKIEGLRGIEFARKEAAILAREVQRGAKVPPDRAPSGPDTKSEAAAQSRLRRL